MRVAMRFARVPRLRHGVGDEVFCQEPAMGLEPTTPALQERCATNCAKPACVPRPYYRGSRAPIPGAGRGRCRGDYGAGVGVGVALDSENVSPVACSTNDWNSAGSVSDPTYCLPFTSTVGVPVIEASSEFGTGWVSA